MKFTTTLALATILTAGTAHAQDVTFEIFVGSALSDSDGLSYSGFAFEMDSGNAWGVGLYMDTSFGAEIGIDIMSTSRRYTGFDSGVETTSFMINGRYPFAISESIEAYAGLGVGMITVDYDGGPAFSLFSGSEAVSGGQVSLGARYTVGGTEAFTEIRYQEAFEDATIANFEVEYNSTSLLFGFRF